MIVVFGGAEIDFTNQDAAPFGLLANDLAFRPGYQTLFGMRKGDEALVLVRARAHHRLI